MEADHRTGEVKRSLAALSIWLGQWDAEKKAWVTPARTTLRDWVKKLEDENMVKRRFEPTGKVRRLVLKVSNWEAYQQTGGACEKYPPHPLRTPDAAQVEGGVKQEPEAKEKQSGPEPPHTKSEGASALVQETNKNWKGGVVGRAREDKDFEAFLKAYPDWLNPTEKDLADAQDRFDRWKKRQVMPSRLIQAASNYAHACELEMKPLRFVKRPQNFLKPEGQSGAWEEWLDWKPADMAPTTSKLQNKRPKEGPQKKPSLPKPKEGPATLDDL
nr:hypothetical protein 6 [bacterium]